MRAYCRTHLADRDLARLLAERVAQDFATTAALLADLAEFDARKLYLPAAHPSLLSYCTEVLHLSKDSGPAAHPGCARGPGFPDPLRRRRPGSPPPHRRVLAGASSHFPERGRVPEGDGAQEQGRDRAVLGRALPALGGAADGAATAGCAAAERTSRGNGGKETGASYAPAHTPSAGPRQSDAALGTKLRASLLDPETRPTTSSAAAQELLSPQPFRPATWPRCSTGRWTA